MKSQLKTPLKIVLACDAFYPYVDGVIKVVDNYYDQLTKQGCKCLLIIPKHKLNKSIKPNVIRVPNIYKWGGVYSSPIPQLSLHLKRCLNQFKPDIVHIHSPFTIGKWLSKYCHKHHIPIVLTFHTKYKDEFDRILKFRWIRKFIFHYIMKVINRVDYVYVPNASVRKTLVTYGYLKSTVNVLHNATDMLPIPNKQGAITYINQTYKINSAYFVILFVGRIIEVKNIMLIIRSLKILVEKNQQFQMVFIGDGSDRKKYENEINKLGLKSYCLFTGAINDSHILAKFYARANLLVVPSVFDNAPIVLLEAASQKTPTVCIRGSDAGSEIQDKKNGYLCNDDSVSLAKVLLYALKNISQNEECGINAYKTLYRSWDSVCDQVIKEYQKIIETKIK